MWFVVELLFYYFFFSDNTGFISRLDDGLITHYNRYKHTDFRLMIEKKKWLRIYRLCQLRCFKR